jgi:hypothetical protein
MRPILTVKLNLMGRTVVLGGGVCGLAIRVSSVASLDKTVGHPGAALVENDKAGEFGEPSQIASDRAFSQLSSTW